MMEKLQTLRAVVYEAMDDPKVQAIGGAMIHETESGFRYVPLEAGACSEEGTEFLRVFRGGDWEEAPWHTLPASGYAARNGDYISALINGQIIETGGEQ